MRLGGVISHNFHIELTENSRLSLYPVSQHYQIMPVTGELFWKFDFLYMKSVIPEQRRNR
jgi:hypothetical protein